MTKKRAMQVLESLLCHYSSEWDGTTGYDETYQEYLEAVNYIEKKL